MRHRKHTAKLGRNTSHRRSLMANMLKALIINGRIQTTLTKAKELRRYADRMITMAKEDTLAARRRAMAKLMVRFNALTSKEARQFKAGDQSVANDDRRVIAKLFTEWGPQFATRQGGYTRIIRGAKRVGDNADTCVIEFVEA